MHSTVSGNANQHTVLEQWKKIFSTAEVSVVDVDVDASCVVSVLSYIPSHYIFIPLVYYRISKKKHFLFWASFIQVFYMFETQKQTRTNADFVEYRRFQSER